MKVAHTISCVCVKLVAGLHHVLTEKALINQQYRPFTLYFLVNELLQTNT